jgi:hypothetical protein
VRPGVLLTAAVIFLVAAGGASGTGEDAAATAKAYVNAYNKRDGATMCRQFSPELRSWFTHLPGMGKGFGCAQIASQRIGYGEESDTPTFDRLTILSAKAQVAGDEARVTVRARYRYRHFPKAITRIVTDRIYLGARDGRWAVVKPGGVWFFTQSAYSIPDNTLDPPIRNSEAHQPAPQPAASFTCAQAGGDRYADPAGDAPSSLDIRSAAATFNADGSVCFRIAFQSPPRPGTGLELRLEQHHTRTNRYSAVAPSIRIGSGGELLVTHKTHTFQAGWEHGELLVLWLAQKGPVKGPFTLRWGGYTKTYQFWEPLIAKPMLGAGDPWEGRGDTFGRPRF